MTNPLPKTNPTLKTWQPLLMLMLALLAWGLYHAAGAYFAPGTQQVRADYRKPLVVLACMLTFLGVWAVLLLRRSGRRG